MQLTLLLIQYHPPMIVTVLLYSYSMPSHLISLYLTNKLSHTLRILKIKYDDTQYSCKHYLLRASY